MAFLDADDWWCKCFFDTDIVCELLQDIGEIYAFPYICCTTNYKYYTCIKKYGVIDGKPKRRQYQREKRGGYDWSHHSSFLHNREFLLENCLVYPLASMAEDSTFMERCFYYAQSVTVISKCIFVCYSNRSSVMHTANYEEVFEGQLKAHILQKRWFEEKGVEYDINYSLFMLSRAALPSLCASCSYKDTLRFFEDRAELINLSEYKKYNLAPKLKKTIAAFVHHPFLYWINCKMFYVPIGWAKLTLSSFPLFSKPFDFLYYRILNRYNADKNGEIISYVKQLQSHM